MKDNFDDLVKRKWENQHFPVDENHRADMVRLLDQQKRRRGIIFWWLGALFVVVAAGGMLLFSPTNDQYVIDSPAKSLQDVEKNTSSSTQTTQSADEAKQADLQQYQNADDDRDAPSVTTSVGEEHAATIRETSEVEIKSQKNTTSVKNSTLSNKSKVAKDKPISTQPTEQKDEQPGKTSNETKPIITNSDPEKDRTPVGTLLQKDTPQQNEAGNVSENVILEISELATNMQNRNVVAASFIDILPVSAIEINSNELAPTVKPAWTKDHPFTFFAEAGVGYVPPSLPDIKSGWSLELGGGLQYGLFSTTNLFLSGGYYLQKGGFDFQRTSTANQPGFGARSVSNSLTPDKLHFIYSKLGVEQRFRRHSVTGALALQWLYGAQGTIDIRSQGQFAGQNQDETKYAWLVMDGMNQLLWSGELEYGYQLTKRIKLSLGLKQYFSRITKDDTTLEDQGYYWRGRLSPFNPSFTLQYRFYGK